MDSGRWRSLSVLLIGLLMLSLESHAEPARTGQIEASGDVRNWEVVPGKGPFEYGRLTTLQRPPGREDSSCLAFYARGRTGVLLRLRQPLRLTGSPSELHLAVFGSGNGDSLFGVFNDRTGRQIRISLGRLMEESRWQILRTDLTGRIRRRPERIAEEAWLEFVGWFIEPDLRRKTETTWLCLGTPAFLVEPYRKDVPLQAGLTSQ